MNNLAWALKALLLAAALVAAALGIYGFVRAGSVLACAHQAPQGPLMRLTVWLTRRLHGEEAAKRRRKQLQIPSVIADWACRVAFVGGALSVAGAVLFADVVSSGTYFPSSLTWSTALRRAVNWILPQCVMAFLFWRLGRSMARKVASIESGVAQMESPSHARTARVACALCVLTGGNLMDGMLIVLRWIGFAIAKLGII